ncbi:Ubiquitin--protein ligase [Bertholletia excelsa]
MACFSSFFRSNLLKELMAHERNTQETVSQFESDDDVPLKQKWRLISSPATPENANSSFECNICLDSVQDPVVTLCGHLYCWACIYKWLHLQRSSPESDEEPKCPVCKANISQSSLVPLYGRGTSQSEPDQERSHPDLVIPRRPASAATSLASHPNQQLPSYPFPTQPQAFHHQAYFPHPYASSNFGGTTMTSFFSPTVGMFGEMVFTRMFGWPDTYSYDFMGGVGPRMRRQEMQLDKSLNRVSIFLFCCFILCLLLF